MPDELTLTTCYSCSTAGEVLSRLQGAVPGRSKVDRPGSLVPSIVTTTQVTHQKDTQTSSINQAIIRKAPPFELPFACTPGHGSTCRLMGP